VKLTLAVLMLALAGCGFSGEPSTRKPIKNYHWRGFSLYDSKGQETASIICLPDYCQACIFEHGVGGHFGCAQMENYGLAYARIEAGLEQDTK